MGKIIVLLFFAAAYLYGLLVFQAAAQTQLSVVKDIYAQADTLDVNQVTPGFQIENNRQANLGN